MVTLGVNLDHIANVREARKTNEPDPVQFAFLAELGGADSITVHLREDRRHIQDRDLFLLKETIKTKLNLEMAATKKIINSNLSKEQKNIMFNEGTERPFTSDLLKEKRKGFYHCANCGNKLFASTAKFDSGTGWPSFSEALPGAFKTKIDYSFGMERVEYHCAKCGVHHGHVFNDGPKESGKRFCNNGLCLIFKPE